MLPKFAFHCFQADKLLELGHADDYDYDYDYF